MDPMIVPAPTALIGVVMRAIAVAELLARCYGGSSASGALTAPASTASWPARSPRGASGSSCGPTGSEPAPGNRLCGHPAEEPST